MKTIILLLTLTLSIHAWADPVVPGPYATAAQWTRYYGQVYLGGDWTVMCNIEQASWDPHYTVDTCMAKSVNPTLTYGLSYIQMEYDTSTGANGSVWDVLPYPHTYTWPDVDYADTWWNGILAAQEYERTTNRERMQSKSFCDPLVHVCVVAFYYDDGWLIGQNDHGHWSVQYCRFPTLYTFPWPFPIPIQQNMYEYCQAL